jgi:asparagine synthase (glutamine-hydrolysing)
MCGIVTILNFQRKVHSNTLQEMTNTLSHRGPDAQQTKLYLNDRVGFGHTRLSLVDLSESSNQPLEIDTYSIIFNGEIYNHVQLRDDLQNRGWKFKTSSDTEVIIRSVQEWGLGEALNKFNGCFVFSLLNTENKKLYIVRDPIGEKQLAYTKTTSGEWIFASEVKAILKHPEIQAIPNYDRYVTELICNIYADPYTTFFKGVEYLKPGHYMVFNLVEVSTPKLIKYFDIDDFSSRTYSVKELPKLISEFTPLLKNSVGLQLQADTEIGSILSGGLDSSFITKIASDLYPNYFESSVKCFNISYSQKLNLDLKNARILANSKGNIELIEIQALPEISDQTDILTYILEEPPTDKVFHSMLLNYKTAKAYNLKSVFNGQGSDEFWLGYLFADELFGLNKKTYKQGVFSNYLYNSSYFTDYIKTQKSVIHIKNILENHLHNTMYTSQEDPYEQLIRFSIRTHLSSLLRHEDKLSMANSIEVRLPFLDIRLIKLALQIPWKIKIQDGREKYIPRKAAQGYLPKSIYNRKKKGFPHPPKSYDLNYEKNLKIDLLNKSEILKEIFSTNSIRDIYTDLPSSEKWLLYTLALHENIFFQKKYPT